MDTQEDRESCRHARRATRRRTLSSAARTRFPCNACVRPATLGSAQRDPENPAAVLFFGFLRFLDCLLWPISAMLLTTLTFCVWPRFAQVSLPEVLGNTPPRAFRNMVRGEREQLFGPLRPKQLLRGASSCSGSRPLLFGLDLSGSKPSSLAGDGEPGFSLLPRGESAWLRTSLAWTRGSER